MPYTSVFLRSFTKQFDKLPKDIKEQVLKGLEKTAADPYAGTRLREDLKDYGDGE